MMARSEPAILDTPISPFLTEDSFRKKAINLNAAKFKRITGWKPVVPQVTPTDLKAQAELFQKAGIWWVASKQTSTRSLIYQFTGLCSSSRAEGGMDSHAMNNSLGYRESCLL